MLVLEEDVEQTLIPSAPVLPVSEDVMVDMHQFYSRPARKAVEYALMEVSYFHDIFILVLRGIENI